MQTIARKKPLPHGIPNKLGTAFLNTPYLLWCVIFILAPLVMVAVYAFTDEAGQFSLETFRHIVGHPEKIYQKAFFESVRYALEATVLCLALAFPLAHFMAHTKPASQRTLMMLVMVPMWMNFLICTYSWRSILETNGIINNALVWIGLPRVKMLNTPGAVILGMVYNYLPFMILPIYTVMSRLNTSLVEAAQDLGANRLSVLGKITVPLSMPGVVSGIIMVFVPSVSTFYISQKLGGRSVQFIGDIIEERGLIERNLGAALSLVLMAFILVSLLALNRFSDRDKGAFVA